MGACLGPAAGRGAASGEEHEEKRPTMKRTLARILPGAAAAALLGLGGCAMLLPGYELRQQQAIDADYMNAVCGMLFQYPEVADLAARIPPSANLASLAQLSDKTRPDARQKAAIGALDKKWAECDLLQADYVRRYDPVVYPEFAASLQQSREALAALWAGQASYGEFNARRAAIHADYLNRAAVARQNSAMVQAQQQQARAAEMAAIAARYKTVRCRTTEERRDRDRDRKKDRRSEEVVCRSY